MKLTAILFTVILLLAGTAFIGCSFNTKDKVRADTTQVNKLIVSEPSIKKDTTVALQRTANRQYTSKKKAKPELVNVFIRPSEDEGLSADYLIPPPPIEEDSIRVQKDDSDVTVFCNLEKEAEYPGGTAAWNRFLNKNLKFPTDSSGNGIVGTVVVKFFIDEDGNVCDVEAVSGPAILGAEAVRVIKKSRKWTPGKLYKNGRHIKSHKKQPIIFRV
jgi:TonB family protein